MSSVMLREDIAFPHMFRRMTTRGLYLRLGAALLIPVTVAMVRYGPQQAWVLLSVLAGVVAADLVSIILGGAPIHERSLVTGLALVALLPVGVDPYAAALTALVAVLFGALLLGGSGQMWIHPAALGVLVVGVVVPVAELPPEGIVPLLDSRVDLWAPRVSQWLFEPLGVRVPSDAWDLILGMGPFQGGALTTGLLLPILLGAVIVYGEDLVPPALPLVMVLVFVGTVELLGASPVEAVLLSEFPLVVAFLAAEPGARPVTRAGLILFGMTAGFLMALFWTFPGVGNPVLLGYVLASLLIPALDMISLEGRWASE